MKFIKKGFLLAGAALITCALIGGCRSTVEQPPTTVVTSTPTTAPVQQPDLPWENGGKQPADYTWEEFEALSDEHQMAFQNAMGATDFEIWKEWVQRPPLPWELEGAKQPEEYTWEEFEALSDEHQIDFQNAMGQEAFEEWMNPTVANPWDESGAKQPEEYTWEEFEALSAEQQMEFQSVLGQDAFVMWMGQALNLPTANPWDEPGAKQPEEYTWEEFEALSDEHQMAFQNAMGSEAFVTWLERVFP